MKENDFVFCNTITVSNTVKTLKFVYDDNGKPFALNYNGDLYLYQTNLQGDVTGLYSINGLCATYEYDAWGNILSYDGFSSNELTILHNNPLRYRGYIFDEETGFYYLQTRYYDPVTGRFINADGQLNGGALGNNLFIYCNNNGINFSDRSGTSPLPFWLLDWFGEIHDAVLKEIRKNNSEIVSSDTRLSQLISLRPDLIDNNNGMYELKPVTWNNALGFAAAKNQLDRYINAYNIFCGTGAHVGTHFYQGKFEYKNYNVWYFTKGEGIIYYCFKEKTKQSKESSTETTTVLGRAACGGGATFDRGLLGNAAVGAIGIGAVLIGCAIITGCGGSGGAVPLPIEEILKPKFA